MQKYFVIALNGQKAVDAAKKILQNRCYCSICNGLAQIEIVIDEPGTYNGRVNKWVDCSYILNLENVQSVLEWLADSGFGGCDYIVCECEQNGCTCNEHEINSGVIATPAAEPADPADPANMTQTLLTVGLFDKATCKQEISTPDARAKLDEILLQRYGLYAYTMLDCYGCYTMRAGQIVHEPSIRIEIVTESAIDNLPGMILDIKKALNQESIMVETAQKQIAFI